MATEDKGIGLLHKILVGWDDPHLIAKVKVKETLEMLIEDFPKPIYIGMFNAPVYHVGHVRKWRERWFGNE